MIVLHALFTSKKTLFVWGEDSIARDGLSARPKRLSSKPSPRPHPFAASESKLHAAIRSICRDDDGDGTACTLFLKLPSARNAPFASPHLLADEDTDIKGNIELAPWSVPGLAYVPSGILDLLGSCDGDVPPGIVIESTVR